jgi:hypothetical protein
MLAGPATALDLEGEWYVLVHLETQPAGGAGSEDGSSEAAPPSAPPASAPTPSAPTRPFWPGGSLEEEEASAGPDYRDEVWRFERVGADLRWTIFPDLAFRDETGRFEDIRGQRARLRHAWRPSADQLAEIRAGVDVDARTARTKTLRPDGRGAFASGARARAGSASAVAFGERWEVRDVDGEPEFTIAASLSSGRTDSLEGVTRFTADSADAEAGRIEGAYARDETETGRFYMWRKGEVRADDAAFAAQPDDGSLFGPGGAARSSVASLQALLDRLADPGAREDVELRSQIRQGIRRLVEERFTRRHESIRGHEAEIESLSGEIERLCVVEGIALAEVDRRFAAGELRP